MNKNTEVGDPCLTPIVHVMITVPRIHEVKEYMLIRAPIMTTPHPILTKRENNLPRGTRS